MLDLDTGDPVCPFFCPLLRRVCNALAAMFWSVSAHNREMVLRVGIGRNRAAITDMSRRS